MLLATSDISCKCKKQPTVSKSSTEAPRAWFDKFRRILLSANFHQSQYDPSPFLCHTCRCITILLVYVDDIISGNDPNNILQLQQSLHASFLMKDLGPVTYFVGLEVHKIQGGLMVYSLINTSIHWTSFLKPYSNIRHHWIHL